MPVDSRSYAANVVLLELDGKPMGVLHAVDGGEQYIDVVSEPPIAGRIAKHPGQLHCAPITLSAGLGMDVAFYQWLAATLDRRPTRKSGAIVSANYNYEELSRLSFDDAMITEIRLPRLDGSSKDAGYLTLTIQPRSVRSTASAPGGRVQTAVTQQRAWTSGNFRVRISGLESASARIATVDAIVATAAPDSSIGEFRGQPTGVGPLLVANVMLTASETVAADFANAFDDSAVKGNLVERSATIDLLGADLSTVLLTFTLSNVGIVRVKRSAFEAGVERVARVAIELYCETIGLSSPTMALGAPAVISPATPLMKPASTATVAGAHLARPGTGP
jgi:hypothetical protein